MRRNACEDNIGGICRCTNSRCNECYAYKPLRTIKELQAVANLHAGTYRRLFANGAITAWKINGVWYSTEDAVIEYAEKR